MPELPEVETIRRCLSGGHSHTPPLIGWRFLSAELLWERSLAVPSAESFRRELPGQEILAIERRGKFLRFDLTRHTLLIHLRMSGDLLVEDPASPLQPHHRAVFTLEEPSLGARLRLAFNDARKFGRIWFTLSPEDILAHLGPEPLDESFSARDLADKLHKARRQLKPLLMDQHFLAGLGNIYTDEALHRARLHPLTPSNRLDEEQCTALHRAIREVLEEGIRRNGASIDWVYRGGDFQNYFTVYQRRDEPCQTCGAPIRRIIVGQRSSYFCPRCQPEPAPGDQG